MRYVVRARLHESCGLSPAEYFTLAVREWEAVLAWMARGKVLGYGRLATGRGTLVVDAASEAEAWAVVRSLPSAPYADVAVTPASEDDPRGSGYADRVLELLERR